MNFYTFINTLNQEQLGKILIFNQLLIYNIPMDCGRFCILIGSSLYCFLLNRITFNYCQWYTKYRYIYNATFQYIVRECLVVVICGYIWLESVSVVEVIISNFPPELRKCHFGDCRFQNFSREHCCPMTRCN